MSNVMRFHIAIASTKLSYTVHFSLSSIRFNIYFSIFCFKLKQYFEHKTKMQRRKAPRKLIIRIHISNVRKAEVRFQFNVQKYCNRETQRRNV